MNKIILLTVLSVIGCIGCLEVEVDWPEEPIPVTIEDQQLENGDGWIEVYDEDLIQAQFGKDATGFLVGHIRENFFESGRTIRLVYCGPNNIGLDWSTPEEEEIYLWVMKNAFIEEWALYE